MKIAQLPSDVKTKKASFLLFFGGSSGLCRNPVHLRGKKSMLQALAHSDGVFGRAQF